MFPFQWFFIYIYFIILLNILYINNILHLWIIIEIITFIIFRFFFSKEKTFFLNLINIFIIQRLSSLIILLFYYNYNVIIIYFRIFIKIGIFPLNFWFYSTIKNRSNDIFIFITIFQKIPLLFLFNFINFYNNIIYIFILLNLFYSNIIIIKLNNIKDLLIFSSISNNSWILLSLRNILKGFNYLFIYAISLLLILYYLKNRIIIKIINILNLRGLPPFILFFNKIDIFLNSLKYWDIKNRIIFILLNIFLIRGQIKFLINNFIYYKNFNKI